MPAKSRHLKNAPIVEAVVDFRIETPADSIQELSEIFSKLDSLFTCSTPINETTGAFNLKTKETSFQHKEIGRRFEGSRKVLQVKLNGITFSKLPPYSDWESILREAKKYYTIYTKNIPDCFTKRIALRYINKIELGQDLEKMSSYVTYPPTIPNAIDYDVESYLQRAVVNNPDENLKATWIQALDKQDKDDPVSIIIDIDIFSFDDFEHEDVWPKFEVLRNFKNKIFFDCITEKTAEKYS